jgi:hypothetical protein
MSQRWADAAFQAARGDGLGRSMPQHPCKPHKAGRKATCRRCCLALPRMRRPARRPHHGHQHRRAAHYRHSAVASSRHRATARGFLPQGLSNTCPQTGAMRRVVASHGQVSNKPKRNRSSPWRFPDRSEDRLWPGRAKAKFMLVAVNQSSKAGQFWKLRADLQGPLVAGTTCSLPMLKAATRSGADRTTGTQESSSTSRPFIGITASKRSPQYGPPASIRRM